MKTNYIKIFTGNKFEAQTLINKLKNNGIEAVVKDEAESARMAGFASSMLDTVEVFVHKDEAEEVSELE